MLMKIKKKSYIRRRVMNYIENTGGGYESMIWVKDRNGKEYSCYLEDIKNPENLTEEEKAKCMDVNALIGTERW
jgi:hypothetical protein